MSFDHFLGSGLDKELFSTHLMQPKKSKSNLYFIKKKSFVIVRKDL